MTVKLIDKATATAALYAAAFWIEDVDSEDYGRVLVHCFRGSIGADWDLEDALRLLEQATAVAWTDHWFEHDLAIVADDKLYNFNARRPERGS